MIGDGGAVLPGVGLLEVAPLPVAPLKLLYWFSASCWLV